MEFDIKTFLGILGCIKAGEIIGQLVELIWALIKERH